MARNVAQYLLPELLSIIFTSTLPSLIPFSHRQTEVPLNVSQVCVFWRDVALTIPFLWTNLGFCVEDENENIEVLHQRMRGRMELWDLYLKRSQPISLRFRIKVRRTWGEKMRPKAQPVCLPLIGKMVENLERWRVIEIDIRPSCFIVVPALPSSLEKLTCCEENAIQPLAVLDRARLDEYIAGSGLGVTLPCAVIVFPTDALRLREVGPLITVPSVLECRHTLASLSCLRIASNDAEELARIFGCYTLPALQHLTLSCRWVSPFDWGIVDLIERSRVSLTVLELNEFDISVAELTEVLRRCPNLKRIQLSNIRRSEFGSLIRFLTPCPFREQNNCTELQDIEFVSVNFARKPELVEDVVDMIHLRWMSPQIDRGKKNKLTLRLVACGLSIVLIVEDRAKRELIQKICGDGLQVLCISQPGSF